MKYSELHWHDKCPAVQKLSKTDNKIIIYNQISTTRDEKVLFRLVVTH